ncbi:MAG TPA: VTT domain-containing protein [Gemmatimonadales bacterium]|nr:VTT domain-containing protein [Gemmatimonadales bacterium]
MVWLLVALAAAALVLLLPALHQRLLELIDSAGEPIRRRSTEGMVLFVALAGLSAMLAFVSSVVLIPIAVHVWGPTRCALLLWLGWFLGGLASYAVGRYLGRPIVERLVRREAIERYERWANSGPGLVPILLLQLAIPSDVAGYVFGLVRCPLPRFLVALAIAEIPYAVASVYLGVSFLERRLWPLLALGIALAGLGAWAIRRAHRHAATRE